MKAVFKWMVVLSLLLTVAGGAAVYWCLMRSDEMLRVEVLKQLRTMAPDVTFGVETAKFDFSHRIRLHGLSIQLPDDVEPAFYVPEVVITLDDQQLTDFEKVSIRRLRLVHPRLHLVREHTGDWNWQGIVFHPNPTQAVPEIEIEHGTVVVELQRDHRSPRKLKLEDLNITSVPAAARKVTAVVSTRIEPAGPLTATIEADLDGPPLKLEAKWLRLPVDDSLLELIGELSPTVEQKLQQARQSMATLAATQAASMPIPAPPPTTRPGAAAPISLKSTLPVVANSAPVPFGLKCNCDLHCTLKNDGVQPLRFQVLAELRSGQFSNGLLPFPLYELRGSVYVDPGQVIVRDLRAENGPSRVYLNTRLAPNQLPRLKLQVRNFQIDDPLKARLPEPLRRYVNSLALTGLCDLDVGTSATQTEKLTWEGELHLSDGFVAHEKFPYPIRDVSGLARLRGNRIDIEGKGRASGVQVNLKGVVLNPGPANESIFVVDAKAVPINTVLLDSTPAPVRKALIDLELRGSHDMRTRFWKEAGIGQKFRISSEIQLRDCSCNYRSFPYRVDHLDGTVLWEDDVITFQKLSGVHDETQLAADGRFIRSAGPGRLELTIRAQNAAFDRSLESALPESVHRLWQEFQPSGRFDVDTELSWTQGQPCIVVLPRVKVSDAAITMRSFPWPMRGIEGEFSYEAPRLVIKSVSAQHDDTQIRGRGLATFPAGEPWRVQFDELHVDDLVPNSTFRKALPPQLQKTFDALNPVGKFSIGTTRQGSVLLSGGYPDGTISSAWDVRMLLADCSLTAGVPIDAIHGRVNIKGNSVGAKTTLSGQLDLDSISVFRQPSGLAHQISRVTGPFSLQDGQFTGGSRVMATPPGRQPIPQVAFSDRISGEFIDGKLTLDVVADLNDEPDYRMQVALTRGRLESYAQQYLRGQSNLAGVMNGWLFLWGKGRSEDQLKGRGELQIAPAALYELPLFVKIFSSLRLDAGDRTAFERADVRYNIANSRYNFEAIHLIGNAINLHGRGYVRFDGAMQLDFYSMLSRNRIQIPVLHELAGILGRGWVGVKVTGNVGAPETRMIPIPEFDEALKQFLGTFEQPAPRAIMRPTSARPTAASQ